LVKPDGNQSYAGKNKHVTSKPVYAKHILHNLHTMNIISHNPSMKKGSLFPNKAPASRTHHSS